MPMSLLKETLLKMILAFVFALLLFFATKAHAADFTNTAHVRDTATGNEILGTTVTNNEKKPIDVYVSTPDGRSRRVGRLRPGESASVTAVPWLGNGGTYIFNKHKSEEGD